MEEKFAFNIGDRVVVDVKDASARAIVQERFMDGQADNTYPSYIVKLRVPVDCDCSDQIVKHTIDRMIFVEDAVREDNTVDWDTLIRVAEEQGYFTKAERDLASAWPTCAVAEYWDLIEIRGDGSPLDAKLVSLGTAFASAICDGDCKLARHKLVKIRERCMDIRIPRAYQPKAR
jgi:hypothetical protein